jgi:GDPmannose 4,6-dehydratase
VISREEVLAEVDEIFPPALLTHATDPLMTQPNQSPGTAIVAGATGQDGFFLTERLLRDGWLVHATGLRTSLTEFASLPPETKARLHVHQIDLAKPQPMFDLIVSAQPDELYNLAGQSSVSRSFSEPLYTWQTNAESVVHLLECIRKNSPHTRFYQASSTDMFGTPPSGATTFDEDSALNPQSPYASAKAAAHLLCHSYREVYGLRIASGILSNHESHRRPPSFLSRKVADHVTKVRNCAGTGRATLPPLSVGNLKAQRDWGFAPDYVEGMIRVLRQITARHEATGVPIEADEGNNYRDYLLATGKTHTVWELIDCAFTIGGFDLKWNLQGDDPIGWHANFRSTGAPAVVVDPHFLRAAEPVIIRVDPGRARRDLGWTPQQGLDVFLRDIFSKAAELKMHKS